MSASFAGNVFLVVAPSGAGKSTLVNALLADDGNIQLSISCTTRPPRPKERHGREYYFVSVEEFETMRDNNELLEWAYVHGNYYGTPIKPILEAQRKGRDILLEIDWQGARQARKLFPNVQDIFILPPSIEALKERLHTRGQDSAEVIQRRLEAANLEISHAHECKYAIINHIFEDALAQMQSIVRAARLRFISQAQHHRETFEALGIGIDS